MIILAWIAILAVAFFAGVNFSTVARAPGHLRRLLRHKVQLRALVEFLGPSTLAEEGKMIKPVFGSYANNIASFDYAHTTSLRTPRNVLLVICIADLVAAYLVSFWCLIVVVAVLFLPLLLPLPNSAKNNNATHVHEILLNLIKWQYEDPLTCHLYCTRERPDFAILYSLVVAIADA